MMELLEYKVRTYISIIFFGSRYVLLSYKNNAHTIRVTDLIKPP